VVCVQNHDQVGNRARGDRLAVLVGPVQLRLAASLLLLAPHPPLIFMGEEYGETNPFPFFCSFSDTQLAENVRRGRREEFAAFAWQGEVPDPQAGETFRSAVLSWRWDDPQRAGLRRLYADLLAARRRWPALRDFGARSARLFTGDVLGLVRGLRADGPDRTLTAYFNLTAAPVPLPPRPAGSEVVLFDSEARRYDGRRGGGVPADHLLPFEAIAFGPSDWPRVTE
jgi:maltooligosyltrehalose trehalohydrolase